MDKFWRENGWRLFGKKGALASISFQSLHEMHLEFDNETRRLLREQGQVESDLGVLGDEYCFARENGSKERQRTIGLQVWALKKKLGTLELEYARVINRIRLLPQIESLKDARLRRDGSQRGIFSDLPGLKEEMQMEIAAGEREDNQVSEVLQLLENAKELARSAHDSSLVEVMKELEAQADRKEKLAGEASTESIKRAADEIDHELERTNPKQSNPAA